MKAKLIPLLLVAGSALLATRAHAVSGTITFSGEVKTNTCKINDLKDSAANFTVPLPHVSADALSTSGATAGRTRFDIRLSDCNTDPAGSAYVHFEGSNDADPQSGHLKLESTAGAKNVQIALLDASGNSIPLNGNAPIPTAVPIGTDGSATLHYAAQYVATGKAQGGKATARVNFTIVYQ
ncbi:MULTISPECIES: fimbrial protein [Cupriavidus]|jgi:major type 1 subunit fimbrin (pilin)|uniref:Type 1 fimbrial protein n=1 Tax=Cupriavidus pauculus TaxID=82633 RepID=A0A5P2H0D1_9BURK|nr:fimbrial protein [Cupriavidus pauculus]QET01194.1 type 1 fimbrial protein [Cupriavidus pauculus]